MKILSYVIFLGLIAKQVLANFKYPDFNETTGLFFVKASTTSCFDDELRNYGDTHGNADTFNEEVIKEFGETTDSVFQSSVETHQQEYNEEIEESQAGFLHRPGTISAPKVCAVRSRLTPSGPSKSGAMWFQMKCRCQMVLTHFLLSK